MNRLVGAQFSIGDSPQVAAQFSVQYSIASILLRGSFRLQDIDTDAVLDPAITECIQKIKIEIDETESGKFTPATVIIKTISGDLLSCTVNEIPGTPAQPLDDEQVRTKAMACLTSGPYAMTDTQARKLIARIDEIDQFENMQEFWNFV
jgi:2-methylcitrate dehydratase PrpD